ncbi:cell division protein FtsK [Campylobacter coli]|uniref:DNA translocase FtsK n=1 Tax=Campylobacter coli TaxID=195 RepID=UPI00193F1FD9|nr:DNA translocase FtsK [Campylobacter coli]MBM3088957.1 cell division protein FtsK [Campylobacter coli]HEB7601598.1 cell division protein FtsK [Campylobacter coli]HEB7609260.1 cell division protein FtsK [Campylobacter coli]HEB7610357.1 cell division protein FtsK [Campylobacter coli]HEB7625957.1 cell division protein FtsK [Campylobacter coli]
MLAPDMGVWLYKANLFLFGEFAYYYPFFLFILNYVYYKRNYKLANFIRRELFGIGFAFFSSLLLFAVFYPNSGYILELAYAIFSTILGHTGSGIFALLLLFFSFILLFPKTTKELFKIEINFNILLKIENALKALLMRVFGGENEKDDLSKIEPKAPIVTLEKNTAFIQEKIQHENENLNLNPTEEFVKYNNINASKNSIITAKENFEKLKNQILDEKVEIDKESIKEAKSFIYENSQQVRNFVQKASRMSIKLDEDFNFISEEEVDMIPERFLKPKKLEDIKQIDTSNKNLDEPSYKRKNIEISVPKQEIKPKIFTKELELRENLMKEAKLEQEYKAYQNEILENKVQEEIKELEKKDSLEPNLNHIIQGGKYNFGTPLQEVSNAKEEIKTQNIPNSSILEKTNEVEIIDFDESEIEIKKMESINKSIHDFIPIIEELEHPYMEPTPIVKIEELEPLNNQINKQIPIQEKDEITEQDNSFSKEQISQEPSQEITRQKAILAKEIELNKALLREIEQGEMEKPKDFELPPLEFLTNPSHNKQEINESEIDKKIYNLLEKLRRFKIGGDVISTYIGPVVTTFEFRPSADVKVSRILNLQDDLTMALMAKSIRIQAPIPGKDVVGIEVPNDEIQTIYLREILESEVFKNAKSPLTIALGKDIVGNAFVTDLKKLPHLLIAGTTGSGKSVGINSMLLSLLYRNSPKTLRLMMIDPKMLEFSIYNDIPHLLTPVITDPKKAVNALSNMVAEMERRYRLMAEAKTKNIENYNEKMKELGEEELPFIVVIIDELADLMMTAGKDVEFYIGRLAQMARASGIHLIVATQRPSVDVVTGLIKANLPSRISYKVGQKIDSKVILDAMGAESLLGRGDCLFTPPGTSSIVRLHAPFASEFEIEKIVDFLKDQQSVEYDESFLKDQQSMGVTSSESMNNGEYDELYEDAKRVILSDGKTSISYLQRKLNIGYNRAANIIDQLTESGVLSEPNSKGQREIL